MVVLYLGMSSRSYLACFFFIFCLLVPELWGCLLFPFVYGVVFGCFFGTIVVALVVLSFGAFVALFVLMSVYYSGALASGCEVLIVV